MTSCERLQAVLNHEPADQLCVDMGAGGQTGIGVCALHRLRKAVLGDDEYLVKVWEPYQMLGDVDDKLREALGLDVAGIPTPSTMFGVPLKGWKEFIMPDGTPCLVPGRFNTTTDEKGDILIYPGGDTSVPPSARMPRNGYFFDAVLRQLPIDEDNMDPADNTEEFGLLSDSDIDWYVRVDLKTLKKEFGKDIVLWGGGIDTQKTLPFGTPEEVYSEARARIDIFNADQTGYVFNSIHNMQSDVPVENILAMFKAVSDARRR